MYENNYGQYQPGPNPYYQPVMPDPQVASLVDAAFGKSLAATIMCWFPVASIIAIFMGSAGLNMVEQAKWLARQRGSIISGKNVAATVLGKIGKIAGIVMTVWWAFYILFIIVMISQF